jgi:hypothetical protein
MRRFSRPAEKLKLVARSNPIEKHLPTNKDLNEFGIAGYFTSV